MYIVRLSHGTAQNKRPHVKTAVIVGALSGRKSQRGRPCNKLNNVSKRPAPSPGHCQFAVRDGPVHDVRVRSEIGPTLFLRFIHSIRPCPGGGAEIVAGRKFGSKLIPNTDLWTFGEGKRYVLSTAQIQPGWRQKLI